MKVIAFPSDQFHNQEPVKDGELLDVLKHIRPGNGFIPKMNISTKVDVNGKEEIPVFTWLKDTCPRPTKIISGDGETNWKPLKVSDVRWNFEKFLVDHKGFPMKRYFHLTMPFELKPDIESLIRNCTDENLKNKLNDTSNGENQPLIEDRTENGVNEDESTIETLNLNQTDSNQLNATHFVNQPGDEKVISEKQSAGFRSNSVEDGDRKSVV